MQESKDRGAGEVNGRRGVGLMLFSLLGTEVTMSRNVCFRFDLCPQSRTEELTFLVLSY
jgi:hypothetical protein